MDESREAHCDYCYAPTFLIKKPGGWRLAMHWRNNDPARGECEGTGKPFVGPGEAVRRRRGRIRRIVDRAKEAVHKWTS